MPTGDLASLIPSFPPFRTSPPAVPVNGGEPPPVPLLQQVPPQLLPLLLLLLEKLLLVVLALAPGAGAGTCTGAGTGPLRRRHPAGGAAQRPLDRAEQFRRLDQVGAKDERLAAVRRRERAVGHHRVRREAIGELFILRRISFHVGYFGIWFGTV